MALKCSVCGKFLARGTAHDHDHDRQPDARHYNPHPPPGGGETPEGSPVIVPPRRRARYGGSPHAPQDNVHRPDESLDDSEVYDTPSGPPSSDRPGHGAPPPDDDDDEPGDNTRDRLSSSPGGGPGDTRPGLPATNPDRPGHRPPPDDDEPEPDHDDGGLDSGIDRPKPKAKRKPPPAADPGEDYDDGPPSTLGPTIPAGFDDYADPGEQEGADWRAWQPGAITP